MRTLLSCAVVVVLFPSAAVRANDRDAAERMLADYEQTVARINAFHVACVAKEWDNEALKIDPETLDDACSRSEETTIFHHDFRWRIAGVHRRTPKPGDRVQFAPLSGVEYRFDDFPGGRQGLHVQWASQDTAEPPQLDHLALRLMGAARGDEHGQYLGWSEVLFGVIPGDARQLLSKVMREAETLELMPDVKMVDQHKTHVLKSKGAFGIHTVCLDPEFGFLPRQIVIHKRDGDLLNAIQLGVEQNPSARVPEAAKARLRARGMLRPSYTITECETRIENVQLDKRDGRFVMTAFAYVQEQTVKNADRTEQVKNRVEYRAQAFDLQPDNWPANAFRNSVDIPNGTRVGSSESGQSYVWMDGKVE